MTKSINESFWGFSIDIIRTLSFLEIGMIKNGLVDMEMEVSEIDCKFQSLRKRKLILQGLSEN